MKSTLYAATLAAMTALSASPALAQVTEIQGKVSQIHTGVHLGCFVVNGQWYVIPTDVNTGYLAQWESVLAAASDRAGIGFLADPSGVDASTGQPYLCHGTQPAIWAHDIDRGY